MTNPHQPVTTRDLVLLDVDAGADKAAVIGRLAQALADAGRSGDRGGLRDAALKSSRRPVCRAELPSRTADLRMSTWPASDSPDCLRRWTSVPPTARPIWCS